MRRRRRRGVSGADVERARVSVRDGPRRLGQAQALDSPFPARGSSAAPRSSCRRPRARRRALFEQRTSPTSLDAPDLAPRSTPRRGRSPELKSAAARALCSTAAPDLTKEVVARLIRHRGRAAAGLAERRAQVTGGRGGFAEVTLNEPTHPDAPVVRLAADGTETAVFVVDAKESCAASRSLAEQEPDPRIGRWRAERPARAVFLKRGSPYPSTASHRAHDRLVRRGRRWTPWRLRAPRGG